MKESFFACEYFVPLGQGLRRSLSSTRSCFFLCFVVIVVVFVLGIIAGGYFAFFGAVAFLIGLFVLVCSGLAAGQRWWERKGGSRETSFRWIPQAAPKTDAMEKRGSGECRVQSD